jgi:alkaline phosphatase
MRPFRHAARSVLAVLLSLCLVTAAWAEAPKNVILLIGDGMGFEQVKAAGLYAHGEAGTLDMEEHYVGRMTTHSADRGGPHKGATDSAAAGTAIATGRKTKNRIVSRTPDGEDLTTVLEVFAEAGKATGLVTTCPMTHATPACFGAHAETRYEYDDIAADYFKRSRPNVLFGAYYEGKGVGRDKARDAGYAVVATRDELRALVARAEAGDANAEVHVSGQFSSGQIPWEYAGPLPEREKGEYKSAAGATWETAPHLSQMADAALRLLARNPKGFFLMIEGGTIDWAGHDNCIERNVAETLEFDRTCRLVLDWAARRDDTLVLITADHECGGLRVVGGRGKGKMPEVVWRSKGHTDVPVPVYAFGPGAERLRGDIDNTDLFPVMTGRAVPATADAAG